MRRVRGTQREGWESIKDDLGDRHRKVLGEIDLTGGLTTYEIGKRVRNDGYVLVWTPDGERLEHRLIMEQFLGRALHSTEVVHHRDGDKTNNDLSNLEVMTPREHAKLHAPESHRRRYGG